MQIFLVRFLIFTGFISFFHCLPAAGEKLSVNWYRTFSDTVAGIRLDAAMQYISAQKLKSKKIITVGIIDSGIDTTVTDLKGALWVNGKETAGDGKDNDHNGYIDDVHGWNFLGTADGTFNMTRAGTEEFRQFKRLYPRYGSLTREEATDKNEFDYYERMKEKAGIDKYRKKYFYQEKRFRALSDMDSLTRERLKSDTLTMAGLKNLPWEDSVWIQAMKMNYVQLLRAEPDVAWTDFVGKQADELQLMKNRLEGIGRDKDKRLLMGDDIEDFDDRLYGNNILMAEGCHHGTFVAGIVAGQGLADAAAQGVYPQAKVMVIRAVPDGDEYDKDVATAIRYAVDNGAKVINLSLGKYTSPHPKEVNRAIEYADRKDVVVIQAAGNDHYNIDLRDYFPTGKDANGRFYPNFLRVGASTPEGLCSSLSNYGKKSVHIFAPGERITAVTEGGMYATESGTSLSAPIVSGIAAMLRSYFPRLKARDICDILMKSVRLMKDPQSSISGGIMDALEAFRMAKDYKGK